jgi:hypothetical protein
MTISAALLSVVHLKVLRCLAMQLVLFQIWDVRALIVLCLFCRKMQGAACYCWLVQDAVDLEMLDCLPISPSSASSV